MTKKDYELIASDIAWSKKSLVNQGFDATIVNKIFIELELHLARSFSNENPRFNDVKFWVACGNKNPFRD